MNKVGPSHSALEECLQALNHLFIDIERLKYEQGYEEIVGGYCELRVATLDSGIPTAKLVAAKRLRLGVRTTEPKRLAFRLARELKVWAGLQHPHVLPLLGFYLGDDYKSAVLISEYMDNGDLKHYITKKVPSFNERLLLVRDLTDGLAYLHTQDPPIRHGDLKPGNVLVNPDRRALLADFGLSKALNAAPTGFTTGNDARGTVRYSGPEILLQGTAAESLSNDMWSWGCLVSEAFTDKIPFADIQPEPQLILALIQGRSPSDANASTLPQQCKDLLTRCWNCQLDQRPTAVDCLGIIESTLLELGVDQSASIDELSSGISMLLSPPFATSTCGPNTSDECDPASAHPDNSSQPQQEPHILSAATSSRPQSGDNWNEIQRRFINQAQQVREPSPNARKRFYRPQAPRLQHGLPPSEPLKENRPSTTANITAQREPNSVLTAKPDSTIQEVPSTPNPSGVVPGQSSDAIQAVDPTENTDTAKSPNSSLSQVGKGGPIPAWAVSPRVLLVDDDEISRKLFSRFLQVLGCIVDVAVDGIGGVNKMNLETYDLVLMDIFMPELDGIQATSIIRQSDHMTPIISMTTNPKPDDIANYSLAGMNDILPKPFTKESLSLVLEKHLERLKAIPTPPVTAGEPSQVPSGYQSPP